MSKLSYFSTQHNKRLSTKILPKLDKSISTVIGKIYPYAHFRIDKKPMFILKNSLKNFDSTRFKWIQSQSFIAKIPNSEPVEFSLCYYPYIKKNQKYTIDLHQLKESTKTFTQDELLETFHLTPELLVNLDLPELIIELNVKNLLSQKGLLTEDIQEKINDIESTLSESQKNISSLAKAAVKETLNTENPKRKKRKTHAYIPIKLTDEAPEDWFGYDYVIDPSKSYSKWPDSYCILYKEGDDYLPLLLTTNNRFPGWVSKELFDRCFKK